MKKIIYDLLLIKTFQKKIKALTIIARNDEMFYNVKQK